MISAPMIAEPTTAPWTNGKPWTAMAVSERSGTAWAEMITSTATNTTVSPARIQARRARLSGTAVRSGRHEQRGREDGAHPGAPTRSRLGPDRPAHRLDPVPD